jgi:oligosaccharide repeat unit polymerase
MIRRDLLFRLSFIIGILFVFLLTLYVIPNYLFISLFLTLSLSLLLGIPFFDKHFDVFEPFTFFAIMYSGFVLSAGYSLSRNGFIPEIEVSGKSGADLLTRTLIFLIIGLVMFYLGYFPNIRKARKLKFRKADGELTDKIRWQMMLIVMACAVIGFFGYYLLFVRPMGGFVRIVQLFGRTSGVVENTNATSMFAPMLWWAALLWYHYILRGYRHWCFWPFLFFVLFTQFIKGRIFSGIITPIIILLVVWRYSPRGRDKYIPIISLFIGVLLFSILAFGVYGYRRASKLKDTENTWEYVKEILSPVGFVELILQSNNLPGVEITTQIFEGVPEDLPYQYGRTFLFTFEQMIPNRLAPGRESKPTVGAMVRNTWYEPWRGNQPPTLVGELYLNFGWLGIIGGMYLFGYFCAFLYKRLLLRDSDWFVIVYAAFVVKFVMLVVKNEFGDHFNDAFLWTALPIWGAVFLGKLLYSFGKGVRPSSRVSYSDR